jgi:hypothetical protein
MLHSRRFKITIPDETAPRAFEATLPEDYTNLLGSQALRGLRPFLLSGDYFDASFSIYTSVG